MDDIRRSFEMYRYIPFAFLGFPRRTAAADGCIIRKITTVHSCGTHQRQAALGKPQPTALFHVSDSWQGLGDKV
ncbi:hypothetical protein ACLOJK_024500 [Asimina triloba]